jgi:beta-lactamase class C
MRLIRSALLAAVIGLLGLGAGRAQTDGGDLERVVARNVQDMLPDDGHGGVAVALHAGGRILFYNYGKANARLDRPIDADAVFNLASVGKLFATTLLAQAVKRGEMRLDDPVANYVTELRQGGDIRDVTLGEIASHTSGLPREPEQYEAAVTRSPISSAFSMPGRPVPDMSRASRTSIRTWR